MRTGLFWTTQGNAMADDASKIPRKWAVTILTLWGRVTHICVGKLTINGSANGLSPGRRQAIIWTNVGILLIRPLGTNFSEILIGIQTFSFKKMYLKMSFAKWHPFCLALNVFTVLHSLFLSSTTSRKNSNCQSGCRNYTKHQHIIIFNYHCS